MTQGELRPRTSVSIARPSDLPRWIAAHHVAVLIPTLLLAALYLTQLYSYVLFHSLAEMFGMVIACGVFMFAWNSRRYTANNYVLFVGIAYLYVAGISALHMLAYKGMGVFQGFDANLPTQLWIAGRYVDALSLLVAPLLLRVRNLKVTPIFLGYTALLALVVVTTFYWRVFPDAFVEGVGLTPFKITSEYIICLLLVGAIALLYRHRASFDPDVFGLLVASIAVAVGSDLSFTLYNDPYGHFNLLGHFLEIISFYLVYLAIVQTGLERPYSLLLRDLRQSEVRFRSTFEQAAVGIAHLGLDGRWLRVNQRLCAIVGYSQDELAGLTSQQITHPADLNDTVEHVRQLLAGEVPMYSTEKRYVRKDGKPVWVRLTASLVREPAGEPLYCVAVVEDIAEQKQAAIERERLLAELARRAAQQEDMLHAVSHDLRSPLTVIRGQAQLLERALDRAGIAGAGRAAIEAIVTGTRRMNAMIQDLVDSARLETGSLALSPTVLDLGEFVGDLRGRLGATVDAERFQVQAPDEPLLVQADPDRLERILTNLLTNALKYSDEGTPVTVRLARGIGPDGRDEAVVSVADRGRGIAPDELAHLFERYYRTQTGREHRESLGLGLYITKGLVEAHGGRVWAESRVGEGTTFHFTLPLSPAARPLLAS